MKHKPIFFLLLPLVCLWHSTPLAQTEASLRERSEKFWSLYANSHFSEMWEMFSLHLRNSQLKDQKEFEKNLALSHIPNVKVEIISIKIKEHRAQIRYQLKVWEALDKEWITDEKDADWVYENGDWYFDEKDN